jgi:hypothetical protein
MEGIGIFNGRLVYLSAIWYMFGLLVYFSSFGIFHQEKSGNPAAKKHDSI